MSAFSLTNSDTMQIRAATPDDLPVIVTMRDELNALELRGSPHAPIQRMSVVEFTSQWGGTIDDAKFCWRIVENDGRAIGFGLIYLVSPLTNPPGAFLHWAYLEESARRLGMGSLLLEQLLEWAKTKRADRVELQFIDDNIAAIAFWTKMGFRPYARKCVRYLDSGS